MKFGRIALFLGVAAAAGAGWWLQYGRPPEVRLVEPTRGSAAEIVYATGVVEPVRWARVASIVRDRLVDICACEGKPVTSGQVLARLDDQEVRANLAEQQARLALAQRETDRIGQLLQRGVTTQTAYDKAMTDYSQIRALVAATSAKLADYTIVAPRDGLVLRQDGEVGEIVELGQILFRIGDATPLQITAEVAEEDIPRVAVGQTALLRTDAFKDRRLEGRVREITPLGDVATKTFRIRIALPDDTPLRFGMSVEANVVSREVNDALLIPTEATTGGAVFVVSGDRLARRPVTLGIRGPRQVQVVEGLAPGERIVAVADPKWRGGESVRVAP